MKTSSNGIKLIKEVEGLALTVYQDVKNKNAVGYGHQTSMPVGEKITREQAEEFLKSDILVAESKVNKYFTKYNFNQNQFDALVSFAFNIGNIDQLTANGTRDIDTISSKMLEYCNSNGVKVTSLVNRRKKERELFESVTMYDVECIDNTSGILSINYKTQGEINASKNFKYKEFIANGTELRNKYERGEYSILLVSKELISILQKIREHFEKPVTILSGYRPVEYNAKVSNSTNSQHSLGTACDIRVQGVELKVVWAYVESILANGGVGYYKGQNFLHIDTRKNKVRWIQPNGANTYRVVSDIGDYL